MQREQVLQRIASDLLAGRPAGRPLKIAIDGRCAAGKTAFATELTRALAAQSPTTSVVCASVDGFHHPRAFRYRQGEKSARGYYEDAFDYPAIVRLLLSPLAGPSFPAECQTVTHDWRLDRPVTSPPLLVGADAILLFEGLFLFRHELNAHWDRRILLAVDSETSIRRAVLRDAVESSPEAVRNKFQQRYEPAWQLYERSEQPCDKADLVIDQNDFETPRIVKG